MIIKKEVFTSYDFDFWSGAADTVATLTEEQFKTVLLCLEDCYPEGMTDTQLNDFFWFENDTIAELLGFADWEELEEQNA